MKKRKDDLNPVEDFNLSERRLYLLLTRSLCSGEPLKVLEEALLGGVDLVQVREKPLTRDEIPWIHAVWSRCKAHGVPLVLNDRIDLAKELGLGWVHLGQEDLKELGGERGGGEKGLGVLGDIRVGLSTHSLEELKKSLSMQPAYVGIGPCFATATKGYPRGIARAELKAMQAEATREGLAAFAIGGIHEGNLGGLLEMGVTRVAVSSCILGSGSPRRVARGLKELLGG